MISLCGDLKGEDYQTFVTFAMERSDAVMFVYHTFGYRLKSQVREIRQKLKPFRVAYRDNSKSCKKGNPEIYRRIYENGRKFINGTDTQGCKECNRIESGGL